jgi:hypothetical protein
LAFLSFNSALMGSIQGLSLSIAAIFLPLVSLGLAAQIRLFDFVVLQQVFAGAFQDNVADL